MKATAFALLIFSLVADGPVATVGESTSRSAGANPIRKIITLMQNMQKEIEAEGAKEKELFEKFMCFCGGSGGDLEKAAEDSRTKIEELKGKLEAETSEKTQIEQDLVQHKADRSGAEEDMKKAGSLRKKEASQFEALSADLKTNIAAIGGAVEALEKGLGASSLLQLVNGDRVHRLAETYPNIESNDRRNLLAFLDQTGDYVPQSGQIVGVVKQMKDEMEGDLKQATDDEEQAAASFNTLKASKEKEVTLASQAIETKTVRAGELAVSIVQTKDAAEDEQEELKDTEKFADGLKEQCAEKEKAWDQRVKQRSEEMTAVGEAIKILNEDDALDTFKKALPSPSALQTSIGLDFLQRRSRRTSPVHKVRALLKEAAVQAPSPQIGLMLLMMNSKVQLSQRRSAAQNFGKVLPMIENMIELVGKQQAEDDEQKDSCIESFAKSADEEKSADEKVKDLKSDVSEMEDSLQGVSDDITTLTTEIASLDKAVFEATDQRKQEHAEYLELVQMNGVAAELVGKALNRMKKFYKPSQGQAQLLEKAAVELPSLLQLSSSSTRRYSDAVAPPDAPETFSGEVKNQQSDGVLGMMEEIIHDLEMGTQEAQLDEKSAQKEYTELMEDCRVKRAENSKSITTKEAVKAKTAAELEKTKESQSDADEDLLQIQHFIGDLHQECDSLMENYDARKEARAKELESLKNAKSVMQSQ